MGGPGSHRDRAPGPLAGTIDPVGHPAIPTASLRRPSGNVLVVDDEPMVREVLTTYLERDGYRVTGAADGAAAMEVLERSPPDLVILDLMLPKVDGLSVLAHLRRTADVPVIVLTARGEEPDRVLGLELGADDYVVKPFSPRELMARVRMVLRRSQPAGTDIRITHGDLVIDGASRVVTLAGKSVVLTPREFDLLEFLAAAPCQVFRRGELLASVWDSSADYQDPSTVTVHIRRLRKKIEADPDQPRRLVTVWGVGYRFDP